MKHGYLLLITLICCSIFSACTNKNAIRLAEFELCKLTLGSLKKKAPDLKEVSVEGLRSCMNNPMKDGIPQDERTFTSERFPGVLFQFYASGNDPVFRLHLTKDFKGFMPNGSYLDMQSLNAKGVLAKHNRTAKWLLGVCTDHIAVNENDKIFFYVKIDSTRSIYPVDEAWYGEQPIAGIDILSNCEAPKDVMTYILEGKAVSKEVVDKIPLDDIENVEVLREEVASAKYGKSGRNKVVEITLKKKRP